MNTEASRVLLVLLSLLFFLSGAAALVYQVVWVRSLTLVFGGSHLAVTAVLSIFMGGLALGGSVIGRRVDRVGRLLRLYGWLELGIAASALVFAGLMRVYPAIYVALARGRDDSTLYLLAVRLCFSVVALIVPTALMGGTLPVLSRVVARQPEDLRGRLSLLYGVNTLGAVFGALMAGFVLLPALSVSTTLYIAVATNVAIGAASFALQRTMTTDRVGPAVVAAAGAGGAAPVDPLPLALVAWGIGLSGFCAMGYEVLWTRVLTIAIGASVYGFAIILVAFLTGIALGSYACGLLGRLQGSTVRGTRLVAWFGVTQLLIGMTALLVTVYLRDLPANSLRLQTWLAGDATPSFRARTWTSFSLAFLYMVVPAFFMGAAFPLAGEVLAAGRRAVGRAVGDVLSFNTIGAILGAAISGLVLIQAFGIERSLELLTVVNAGLGLAVLASLRRPRWLAAGAGAMTVAALAVLALNPQAGRIWDTRYFAIFRSNQPEAFRTPAMVREAVANTDVLYYAEGVESIVSVIQVKGGERAFVTNGRVEASSHPQAQQCQFTLGHLPMLLAHDPKDVLVVGLGSGMTAGATAVHPGVEHVTIVEIEPRVLGVARAFADDNHRVLDNPKVRVVLNDGRNFLLTTNETFDVITADPIHPWFRGAGYLYSSQYFALAAAHLRPGGVVAQWLPIYELTPRDLRSVVKTFQAHFAHTMLWLTHYDAEIVGSNTPFLVDEEDLDRRIAAPGVVDDLRRVMMGSATDLLSYFVMGTGGMARFAQPGTVNTDDNLYLEFSAPFSIASPAVMAEDVDAIAAHRESILPYLEPPADANARAAQKDRWARQLEAGRLGDPALSLYLAGARSDPRFTQRLAWLASAYPWYAPGRFLASEYRTALSLEPRLLSHMSLVVAGPSGERTMVEMSAVLVPVSRTRASIVFADAATRVVFGQLYVDEYDRGDFVGRFAADVMGAVRDAYELESAGARAQGRALPPAADTLGRIRAVIASKVEGGRRAS